MGEKLRKTIYVDKSIYAQALSRVTTRKSKGEQYTFSQCVEEALRELLLKRKEK